MKPAVGPKNVTSGVLRTTSRAWTAFSYRLPPRLPARLRSFGITQLAHPPGPFGATLFANLCRTFSPHLCGGLGKRSSATGLYRLPLTETFTPYAGLGVGISVPDVETTARFGGAFDGMPRTFDYKLAGPVAQAQIGMEAKITESISAFAEYKFDYSWNSVDLNGGGRLDANIGASQFILGVSYKFNCYTVPASLK
jgi:hypothetical protein